MLKNRLLRLRRIAFSDYGYAKLFFSVAASLVVLFKRMLKKSDYYSYAELFFRITATPDYYIVWQLR